MAAMMRTSTVRVVRLPTRWISPVSSARSNLTWVSSGSSPTSSRKMVEPSASSKRPIWRSKAPVKAPFSWPNSTDSTRFSGIAPQLTVWSCFLPRGEAAWIAWATISLPEPLSPSISTETRARAALAAIASAVRNWGAEPTISSKPSALAIFSESGRSSPAFLRRSVALLRAESSRSGASGLTMKSLAPARIASTATGDVVLGGEDEQRQIGPERADLADQLGAFLAGQPVIEQDRVELGLLRVLEHLLARRRNRTRRAPTSRRARRWR